MAVYTFYCCQPDDSAPSCTVYFLRGADAIDQDGTEVTVGLTWSGSEIRACGCR